MQDNRWIYGDREFQGLLESVITFFEKYFWSCKILQKLGGMTIIKSTVWEEGDECTFIILNLFFSTLVETKI
jgi:hypothetical protein